MGLLTNLLLSFVHLFLVATDLLFFLLLVRMLTHKWQPHWLIAFDSMGKPLVEWLTGHIERGVCRVSKRAFPEKVVLLIGMLAICLVRLFVAALFSPWESI